MSRADWPRMPDKLGMKYNPDCPNITCNLGYVRGHRLCRKCNPIYDERKIPFEHSSRAYNMDAIMGTTFGY